MRNKFIDSNYGFSEMDQAMQEFGLKYNVVKTPLQTVIDGQVIELQDNFATVREDNKKILGVVGSNYEVIQNHEQFQSFEPFAKENGLVFVNGGSLKGGRITYIQAKHPEVFKIGGNDEIHQLLTILSSFDGTKRLQVLTTSVRVVCENTFAMASRSGENKTTLKHTPSAIQRMTEAMVMMKNSFHEAEMFKNVMVAASESREYNSQQIQKFVELMFPAENQTGYKAKGRVTLEKGISTRMENTRAEFIDYLENGVGQKEIERMTPYKLFNGITGFVNNMQATKKENMDDFLYFGAGGVLMNKAYAFVIKELESGISVLSN